MKKDTLRERARRKLRAYVRDVGTKAVAAECQVGQGTVARWVAGTRDPSGDSGAREALEEIAGIPREWWRASK